MVIILDKPNYPPYVCIRCGVGNGRDWYLLLDLPIDNYFNPVNNGQIFLCNECWLAAVQEASRIIQIFLVGHEAYKGVEPTYENEDQLVLGLYDGPGVPDSSVPELSDTTTEPNTTTTESDTDPESTDQLSTFTEFFTPTPE